MPKYISLEQYKEIKNDILTIDVRTKEEVAMLKSFPWADNIYVEDLCKNYERYLPDKNKTIVTVCNAGNRSGFAADFLLEKGYENSYVLDGGIYSYFRKFDK